MSNLLMGPPYFIDGPIPAPPRYRLLDVAQVIEDPDPHWQLGAQVWAYPNQLPTVWDTCDHGTFTKPDGDGVALPEFPGYTVVLPITCTTRGLDPNDIEGFKNRAVAAFTASESYAIEHELSQGDVFPLFPHFTDANAEVLNGGADTAGKAALALLADAVGGTARQGIIHATPGTIVGWGEFLLRVEGSYLYTIEGTPIVRGTGYLGATPDGESAADDGQAWAFATGPVQIRRGEIYVNPDAIKEAMNRSSNVVTFYAERSYLVDWDTTLQAAILVDWTS